MRSIGPGVLLSLFVFCGPLASGCGGKSDSDVDGDPMRSSDGGASSNSGNSGGSSSAAGGAASAGSTTGGSGGTDSSGGTDNDSDSSTGGSGATSGGSTSSSTTGVNPMPPDELVDGCRQACEAEVASDCPSAPTAADCEGSCTLITRVESCADKVGQFFDCVAEDDVTSCSDDGDVVFDTCVSEQLDAYSCIFQEAPDDSLQVPCEEICTAEAAADCAGSDDLPGCVLGCQSVPTILPTCAPSWQDYVSCAQGSEYTCDEDGEPQVAGCDGEILVFLACAYPELNQ